MYKYMTRCICVSLCALTLAAAGQAQQPTVDSWQGLFPAEAPVVERAHCIIVDGRRLRYVSRAGRLPILDDQTGAVMAWISFTAYVVEGKPGDAPRPLTFLWNGGPGANSALVHLVGFGPRRIPVPDNPPLGGGHADRIVDNQDTWLTESDLVFVDAIGTGFSRAVSAAVEPKFLNTLGDAEAFAEFIRLYRDRYHAWDQPLIEGGESYGVTRAAWVADILLRRGIPLDGVVLIGWDIPLGKMPAPERHALALPTYTAAAFYHKRLAPELQSDFDRTIAEVTQWSQGPYLDAIRNRDSLGDAEHAAIVAKLARYTGLRPEQIDAKTLSIATGAYSETLLKDEQRVIGRYDSRFVASTVGFAPGTLPRIGVPHPIDNLVERYERVELGYVTPLRYAGSVGAFSLSPSDARREVGRRWTSESSAIEDAQRLESAFKLNPKLKVIDMCGFYDLGANCIGDQYLIDRAGPPISGNTTLRRYRGGHAPYYVDSVRAAMKNDFARFARSISSPAERN